MTIEAAIQRLLAERALPSRFRCRAILVRTIGEYAELLEQLKNRIPGVRTVGIDELFIGEDVLPNYPKLIDDKYKDEWLILPGASEYLRLFHANEATARRFDTLWSYKSSGSSMGRILIPLWGCETLWFGNELRLDHDERHREHFWDCTDREGEPQRLRVQVLAGDFAQYRDELARRHDRLFVGVRDWYHYWYDPQPDACEQTLITGRIASVKPLDGDVKIQVVRDALDFLRENLADGAALNAQNCPEEAQKCLFDAALQRKTVDAAILSALNLRSFRPLDAMGKWRTMSAGQRELVFLWYALHPDASYLCHCVEGARDALELEERVPMEILHAREPRAGWVQESQALFAAMRATRGDAYFRALDAIPAFEDRLEYLAAEQPRERVYLLRMVGQWLQTDPDAALENQKLKELYPALAAYLSSDYPDAALGEYFASYKRYKLSNALPSDADAFASRVTVEDFDARYKAICEVANEQSFALWIDGLGAEWLPLLVWALKERCDGKIASVSVARALLPTETEFNELWRQMDLPYAKLDKLDKLAHQGVTDDKDYYACVEAQIRFVCQIAERVDALLQEHGRVLIAGDHGASRLAARYFHKLDGLPAPQASAVGSHGRYCRLDPNARVTASQFQRSATDGAGNRYLVFANYDHYSQSGRATGKDDSLIVYGEIHGGATPEEALVPVIAVDSRREIPLTAEWAEQGNSVKIRMNRAKCSIRFSRPVRSVEASIEDRAAECGAQALPARDWTITFRNLRLRAKQSFSVTVIADGKLVPLEPIEIRPALGDDPF